MTASLLRGRTAIAGVGQTAYFKRGKAQKSVFALALEAILNACADAGVPVEAVEGFCSFGAESCQPERLAAALGVNELRHSSLQWGGGGGGVCGALANAAAAIISGQAQCVVVYRAIAQGEGQRFGQAQSVYSVSGEYAYAAPYGVMTPAEFFAPKINRFMHDYRIGAAALRSISLTSYRHAQTNPLAVMYGRPLDEATYDSARWIVEPLRLYDCCLETDGAAAVLLVSAERAKDLRRPRCFVLAAAAGCAGRATASVHNAPDFASANFKPVAARLFHEAGLGPADVDVLQSYENFTGGVVMSMIEHGFCDPHKANEFFTPENLSACGGRLPLNTSGGHLAEAYVHGLSLVVEAVRQIRGMSPNQVPDAHVSMVSGGPLIAPVSGCILGSEAVL